MNKSFDPERQSLQYRQAVANHKLALINEEFSEIYRTCVGKTNHESTSELFNGLFVQLSEKKKLIHQKSLRDPEYVTSDEEIAEVKSITDKMIAELQKS